MKFIQPRAKGPNLKPHLHFLVTERGVDESGVFRKIPRLDDSQLAEPFAREGLGFLVHEELISPEWAERLLSWRHPWFNVHSRTRAKTKKEAERVGKYMLNMCRRPARLKTKFLSLRPTSTSPKRVTFCGLRTQIICRSVKE